MTIAEAKQKLVDLERSQVGYKEGPNNYNKYANDPKITKLYGWNVQNQPWCCTFVNWVYLNAFGYDVGSRLTYGGTAACSSSAQLYRNHGAFGTSPEVGDQAFFYVSGGINHTGIVVEVDGITFTTIEGNYSDKVSIVRHSVVNADFAGVGKPCWQIVESAGDIPDEQEQPPEPPQGRTVLRKGMTGSDVKALQEKLIAAGYDVGPDGPDGEYGNNTFKAVAAFQEDHHLTVDGVAGPETQKALAEEVENKKPEDKPHDVDFVLPDLQTGDKGDAVVLLQSALNLLGFDCGRIDGQYGPATAAALNRFKEDRLLDPDGIADAETWEELLGELLKGVRT